MKQILRKTLTVDEAAHLLGISRGLAYQAVREGTIPSIRIGRRIVIPAARFHELLQTAPHNALLLNLADTHRAAIGSITERS